MRAKLLKQSALEASLKGAIRKHQFRLVYQPQFASDDTETVTGAEALLRWYDPQVGNIAPSEFIPIAEKSGFIVELGNLVVEMLVEQVARWLNSGLVVPEIALNLSARNLQQEGFVDFLINTIGNFMVPRSHFKIEITEAVVMEQGSQEVANLFKLRDEGFKISLDDFGTGYSSLSYLKALPLSELKIDKSFIDGLGDEKSNDGAISKAILSMSKALELSVIAEGVETEKQLRWLQQNGCDRVQGFLLGKPMETSDFERMLILK
jgi:two-component system CheB/CheR fusion protein